VATFFVILSGDLCSGHTCGIEEPASCEAGVSKPITLRTCFAPTMESDRCDLSSSLLTDNRSCPDGHFGLICNCNGQTRIVTCSWLGDPFPDTPSSGVQQRTHLGRSNKAIEYGGHRRQRRFVMG